MESPKCLCCGREIASGELCSDCERELRVFLEYRGRSATVLDVSAEFDLTVDEALMVLRSFRERLRQRRQDEAAEAEWYAHVMHDYDATRRESGWRPGQE